MATSRGTSIADTEYARKRREVYSFLKDLKSLGAQSNIRIPRIAVIGAQSTGKSSLVEAVTGINVPRDSGTCTRCPMECTISTEPTEWSCQVSLEYDPDGIEGQLRRVSFSPVLKVQSKAEVEIWIRRAQTALLSPHAPADSFKTKTHQDLQALTTSDPQIRKFSRDVIVVDINDPEGTDLSFIDLPGLVQNLASDDLITLVKGLVQHYIADESTIILITVPAADDMENQQAARLARDVDPDGKRTIAVVTKPDNLGDGERGLQQRWLDIFQGRSVSHQLSLGYYVVRLPNDVERSNNLTRQELDRRAHELFASTPPWKMLLNSGRLGLPNFIADISKLLMKIVEESIPRLIDEANARLANVNQAISLLPEERETDATVEVSSRISDFCQALQKDVYGRNESKADFKIAIYKTRPDFRPFVDYKQYRRPDDPQSQRDEMDPDIDGMDTEFDGAPLDLIEVRDTIKKYALSAKERLIGLSVDKWNAPAVACYERICAILREFINEQILKHFAQFKPLESYLGKIIREECLQRQKTVSEIMRDTIEREKTPYITQNNHNLISAREGWLQHYRASYGNAYSYSLVTVIKSYRLEVASPSPSASIRPHEDELTVMAYVRAYVQVAYKRIIDHVPMLIQKDLNQVFVDGLQKQLIKKLDLGGADASERLEKLLEEDPVVAAQRVQLATDKARLEEIVVKLSSFAI
ncbi:P-loop containing nucleoside triphosphate hydrolase protein [Fomitopsis serialis]|uniref:P-loop containing nucleoside triphosphate hydrolase protein n=1 Tax=Fomitopsis serialis TaxID=139415 RepID=UPI0020079AD5|nr:P-loop containing nucleoside triphosphate hydrolase protein [Neoantrodia serialis]KAH9917730.1 P-loop containing nucleoside triphosphate hydrolase protein [Neoantrodia serialis]